MRLTAVFSSPGQMKLYGGLGLTFGEGQGALVRLTLLAEVVSSPGQMKLNGGYGLTFGLGHGSLVRFTSAVLLVAASSTALDLDNQDESPQ